MKLIAEHPTFYEFGIGDVTRWTRQKLIWSSKSVELKDWKNARNLFLPTSDDLINFPGVEYRLQLTSNRPQEDPLFTSVPVRIKKGTKTILQVLLDDDKPPTECRIKKLYKW